MAILREALTLPQAIQSWSTEAMFVDLVREHGTPVELEQWLLGRSCMRSGNGPPTPTRGGSARSVEGARLRLVSGPRLLAARLDLLQGTLDMLIRRTLQWDPSPATASAGEAANDRCAWGPGASARKSGGFSVFACGLKGANSPAARTDTDARRWISTSSASHGRRRYQTHAPRTPTIPGPSDGWTCGSRRLPTTLSYRVGVIHPIATPSPAPVRTSVA